MASLCPKPAKTFVLGLVVFTFTFYSEVKVTVKYVSSKVLNMCFKKGNVTLFPAQVKKALRPS